MLEMAEKISEIILNTMFEYSGYGCKCVKDTENVAPDMPPKTTLKMYEDITRPLAFSYAKGEGLNLTGNAGGVIEKNILGKLLALPKNDTNALMGFFENFGFLLPLSSDEYESADAEALLDVVNRIKATIYLMNAIGKRNYRSVLVNIAYLLYSPQVTISFSSGELSTCRHRFTALLESYNLFPDLSQDAEAYNTGKYSVPDTFIGGKNHIDVDFYNAVRSGADTDIKGSKDPRFKNLTAMYVGCRDTDHETRMLIDFFYHFQTEIAVFNEVRFQSIRPYSHIDEESFSEDIKKSLLKLARIVVAEEINYNISGIQPRYNGMALKAAWQVDSLIQALYFSIFYMKAGSEIYKECENPNCKRDRFFLVEATRTNKKYCCPQCANAAAAQRHRNRKLEK
jgi:hypothetical protein